MNNHRIGRALAALALTLASAIAGAADFTKVCQAVASDGRSGPDGLCHVELRGDIVPGDAGALRLFLALGDNADLARTSHIRLISGGGDVAESLRVSDLMRKSFASANVPADSMCSGSCFLIWISAATRTAAPGARIGLYRPSPEAARSIDDTIPALHQARAMAQVREFLKDQGVSQRLSDAMLKRAPSDPYWLTVQDHVEIGSPSPWFKAVLASNCHLDAHAIEDVKSFQSIDSDAPRKELVACKERLFGARAIASL